MYGMNDTAAPSPFVSRDHIGAMEDIESLRALVRSLRDTIALIEKKTEVYNRRPEARLRLHHPDDLETLQSYGPQQLAQIFREAGDPLSGIEATRVSEPYLYLYFRDERSKNTITSSCGSILCKTLGIGYESTFVKESYLVRAEVYEMFRSDFEHPEANCSRWSRENKACIDHAFWTFSQLILVLRNEQDALRLCAEGLVLSGMPGYAK